MGRALVGMDFDSIEDQQACLELINSMVGDSIMACQPVGEETLTRLLG